MVWTKSGWMLFDQFTPNTQSDNTLQQVEPIIIMSTFETDLVRKQPFMVLFWHSGSSKTRCYGVDEVRMYVTAQCIAMWTCSACIKLLIQSSLRTRSILSHLQTWASHLPTLVSHSKTTHILQTSSTLEHKLGSFNWMKHIS